jgi:hypothetical protein
MTTFYICNKCFRYFNIFFFIFFFRALLKGPKREMFIAGIFTEIRPVWVGDLETRPKNLLGGGVVIYIGAFSSLQGAKAEIRTQDLPCSSQAR